LLGLSSSAYGEVCLILFTLHRNIFIILLNLASLIVFYAFSLIRQINFWQIYC